MAKNPLIIHFWHSNASIWCDTPGKFIPLHRIELGLTHVKAILSAAVAFSDSVPRVHKWTIEYCIHNEQNWRSIAWSDRFFISLFPQATEIIRFTESPTIVNHFPLSISRFYIYSFSHSILHPLPLSLAVCPSATNESQSISWLSSNEREINEIPHFLRETNKLFHDPWPVASLLSIPKLDSAGGTADVERNHNIPYYRHKMQFPFPSTRGGKYRLFCS